MTDKEKLTWVKVQLYILKEIISENNGETVEETDISDCLWRIINGYDLIDGSDDKVEW